MNLRRSVLASLAFSIALLPAALGTLQAQATTPPPAQQANRGSVSGIVKDQATGLPLSQVDVVIANTTLGAKTNQEGRFVITNASTGIFTLQARRIGYSPAVKADIRITAGQATEVEILMSERALVLSGVVTTGVTDPTSGTKTPFTVTTVGEDKLQVPSLGSPLSSLAGKVPGLTARSSSGAPGSDVIIQMRNPLSVTGFTQPMIIVDGVIQMQDDPTANARGISGNPLDINPETIESIEIVRGAAAAALYGQRAANGVINIKTKRGGDLALNTTRYTFGSEIGAEQLGNRIPISKHHRFLVDENNQFIDTFGRPIAGRTFVADPNQIIDNEWGVPVYDNTKAMFRTGGTLLSTLSVQQSTLSTNFSITGGASNQSGIVSALRSGLGRHNLGVNLDHREGDKLQLGLGLFVNRQFQRSLATGSSVFSSVLDISPDIDIRARDPLTGDFIPFPDGEDEDRFNPLYFEPKRDEWEKRIGVQTNASATFRPNSVWSFLMEGGYQRSDRQQQLQWLPRGSIQEDGDIDFGQYDIGADLDESFNGQMRAGMLTGFGDWTVRSFASLSGQVQKQHGFEVLGDSVFQLGPDIDFTRRQIGNQTTRDIRTLSYSGTLGFDYRAKYIVDLVYRRDGNSNLPAETRWRGNGRVSMAWSMGEESWWPLQSLTLFKPRYSIGTAGNNPQFAARYETYTQNQGTERIFKQNMGNTEIVPEEVTEHELGIDMSVNNRFGITLNYVHNKVKNSIRADTIVSYTGFDTQQRNLGDLSGTTIEATLDAQWINSRDLRWSSTLVLDRSRQKISRYPRRCAPANTTNTLNRECEGYVFGQMYGFYHVTDKADLAPRHAASGRLNQFDVNDEGYVVAVGPNGSWQDARWGQTVDIDGLVYNWGLPILAGVWGADGARAGDRSVVLGQGLPDMQFGLSNQLQYRRWNLHMQFVGQVGGLIFNRAKMTRYAEEIDADLDQSGKPDYAKKPVTYYTAARSATSGSGGLTANSTSSIRAFMENGDYLKVSELRLGYTLTSNTPVLNRLGIQGGSIALSARNLFTLTDYSGYDPEVGGQESATTARVDAINYPSTRQFGLQLRLIF